MIPLEPRPQRTWTSIFITGADLKRVSGRVRVRVRVKLGLEFGGQGQVKMSHSYPIISKLPLF